MRRTLFLLSLSAVLALAACGGNEETTAATTDATATVPLPLPADVATVGTAMTSTATATIEASAAPGTLVSTGEFVSPVRSEVAAKVIGRVSRVYVDEGARVTRGQPLLSLETDYLRLNLQAAEAHASRRLRAVDRPPVHGR